MSAQTTKVASFEIGMLVGFDETIPLVVFPAEPLREIKARATVPLTKTEIGAEVAIVCENGDRERPLVIGRILSETELSLPQEIKEDIVRLEATDRIELKVGRSIILLEKDGHITIRGDEVVSQAKGANMIRGGSVNMN